MGGVAPAGIGLAEVKARGEVLRLASQRNAKAASASGVTVPAASVNASP